MTEDPRLAHGLPPEQRMDEDQFARISGFVPVARRVPEHGAAEVAAPDPVAAPAQTEMPPESALPPATPPTPDPASGESDTGEELHSDSLNAFRDIVSRLEDDTALPPDRSGFADPVEADQSPQGGIPRPDLSEAELLLQALDAQPRDRGGHDRPGP